MKKCVNCRKQFDDELFLCPHCGKIYGDPNMNDQHVRRFRPAISRRMKRLLSGAAMLLLLLIAVPLLGMLFFGEGGPNGPGTTNPHAAQFRYALKVIDEKGAPVPSVQIVFSRDESAILGQSECYYTTTDDSGHAECMMSEGGVLFAWVASAPDDYVLEQQLFALYPQTNSSHYTTLTLIQQETAPFVIRLVDLQGNPVSNIPIRYGHLRSGKETQLQTDANGCIAIPSKGYSDLSGFYISVLAVPNQYDPATVGTYWPEAGETSYTITVQPRPKVIYTVTVVDDNGNPLKDVGVALVEYNGLSGYYPGKDAQDCPVATTDENGCCEFVMDEEGDYAAQLCFYPTGFLAKRIIARFDDYFNATVTVSDISSGNTFAGMCMINVRIVDQDGNPLPWVYLTYDAFDGMMRIWGERHSNLDGYLTIWCDVNSKGTITAQMGAVTIEVPFDTNTDAGTTIEIVFHDESDAPVMPITNIE